MVSRLLQHNPFESDQLNTAGNVINKIRASMAGKELSLLVRTDTMESIDQFLNQEMINQSVVLKLVLTQDIEDTNILIHHLENWYTLQDVPLLSIDASSINWKQTSSMDGDPFEVIILDLLRRITQEELAKDSTLISTLRTLRGKGVRPALFIHKAHHLAPSALKTIKEIIRQSKYFSAFFLVGPPAVEALLDKTPYIKSHFLGSHLGVPTVESSVWPTSFISERIPEKLKDRIITLYSQTMDIDDYDKGYWLKIISLRLNHPDFMPILGSHLSTADFARLLVDLLDVSKKSLALFMASCDKLVEGIKTNDNSAATEDHILFKKIVESIDPGAKNPMLRKLLFSGVDVPGVDVPGVDEPVSMKFAEFYTETLPDIGDKTTQIDHLANPVADPVGAIPFNESASSRSDLDQIPFGFDLNQWFVKNQSLSDRRREIFTEKENYAGKMASQHIDMLSRVIRVDDPDHFAEGINDIGELASFIGHFMDHGANIEIKLIKSPVNVDSSTIILATFHPFHENRLEIHVQEDRFLALARQKYLLIRSLCHNRHDLCNLRVILADLCLDVIKNNPKPFLTEIAAEDAIFDILCIDHAPGSKYLLHPLVKALSFIRNNLLMLRLSEISFFTQDVDLKEVNRMIKNGMIHDLKSVMDEIGLSLTKHRDGVFIPPSYQLNRLGFLFQLKKRYILTEVRQITH